MPPDPLVRAVHADVLGRPLDGHEPSAIRERVRARAPLLPTEAVESVVGEVLAHVVGLGPLDALLADPAVSEVMVNGPGAIWVERAGVVERTGVMVDRATVEHLIERVVAPLGLRIDRSSPMVDARLPDGSRVNAVVPPLAIDGPCLTIRRFHVRDLALADLAAPDVAAWLAWAVAARLNIVVCGGTGSGKTTLLNALAGCIPAHERVITIEDAAELRLPLPHVVRLESRPPSADGVGAVTIRRLVHNALRMRPDRIVVGEVRGAEALDMLQAMNTGHEGSMSTCHANSPADALRRLETMTLMADVALPLGAVRDQLGAALDAVVQVERRPDGRRTVVAVGEVMPCAAAGAPSVSLIGDERGLHAAPQRAPRRSGAPAFAGAQDAP